MRLGKFSSLTVYVLKIGMEKDLMEDPPAPLDAPNELDTGRALPDFGSAEPDDAAQDLINTFHGRVEEALVYPYALDRERNIIQRHPDRQPPRDICAPLLATDLLRSSTGHASVLRVEMLADDATIEVLDLDYEDLGSSTPRADAQLRRAGLHIPASARDMSALLRSFRARLVRGGDVRPGWHPSGKAIFGLRDGRAVVPPSRGSAEGLPFLICQPDAHALRLWREQIATSASGNPYVLFGLCLALSGPILQLIGRAGFGFNLVSHSSRGKSTLLKMMAGVWPHLQVESWDHSAAALEDVCRVSNGSLLLLDELPRGSLNGVIDAIYLIMNGRPRGVRRHRELSAGQTRPADWAMPMFSSSEKTLATLLAQQGKTLPEGARVRMIELQPSALWENHHGHGSTYDMLKKLEASMPETAAVAGPMFVQWLAGWYDKAQLAKLQLAMLRWLEREMGVDRATAPGTMMRCLETFACVVTAGQLASRCRVLPQSPMEVREAVLAVARAWASPEEAADITHAKTLERLRDWLGRYADARLVELDDHGVPSGRGARIADGWRTPEAYLLLKGALGNATGIEGSPTEFLRYLLERGILRRGGQPNSMQVRMGPAIHGRPWVYRIDRLALAEQASAPEAAMPG
jgi:energy-coupling factor transporter ATP-binding protein EcfA2